MRTTLILILVVTTLLSDWAAAQNTYEFLPNPDGCGQYSFKKGDWCVCLTGFRMGINPVSEEPNGGYDSKYHYTVRQFMNCEIDRDYLNSYMTEYCAPESGTCSCKGTVLYGEFGDFGAAADVAKFVLSKPAALRAVDGSIECSAAEFRDPLLGKTKHCLCVSAEKYCDENSTEEVDSDTSWDWQQRKYVYEKWCQCKPGYAVARDLEHKSRKYLPDLKYNFKEIGKEGSICAPKRPVKPCMDDAALQKCLAGGTLSKWHNGCRGFAKGWKEQANGCHSCSATTRDYGSCSLSECLSFCRDMYNPREVRSAWVLCGKGCHRALSISGLSNSDWVPPPATSPASQLFTQYESCMDEAALQKCLAWGLTSKEGNGCLGFAKGWKKQANGCHSCSATEREYDACSKSECTALCADMYEGNRRESERCVNGCNKYAELLADAHTAAATPPRYVLGEQGADDCPDGYAPITTFEECEAAALELDAGQKLWSSDWVEIYEHEAPTYCSLATESDMYYYFNTNPKNLGRHHANTPVCKLLPQPNDDGPVSKPKQPKSDSGLCANEVHRRCCAYNADWGMVPKKTWGRTPQTEKQWHRDNQCDEVMGKDAKNCPCDVEPVMRGATRRVEQDIARRLLGSGGDDVSPKYKLE